jgi:hypothetical protein
MNPEPLDALPVLGLSLGPRQTATQPGWPIVWGGFCSCLARQDRFWRLKPFP